MGTHTIRALHEENETWSFDNLSTAFSAHLPERVPLFIGDAGDENLVEGLIAQARVYSIMHFGSIVVPEQMRDPLLSTATPYHTQPAQLPQPCARLGGEAP